MILSSSKSSVVYSFQVLIILFVCSHVGLAQKFFKPPDTLVVEGIPQIPISEQRKFDKNIRWKSSNFKGWKAGGDTLIGIERKKLFFITASNGTRQKVDTLIYNSDYIQFQPSNGSNILYTITHPKSGNRLLFKYDTESKKRIMLTNPKKFDTIGSYEWSSDGEYVYLTNQNTKESFTELFRLNIETGDHELLATYKGDANYLVDANEKYLILTNYFSNSHSVLSLLNLNIRNSELTPFTSKDGYVSQANFSRDKNGVWFLSNKDGSFFDFYFYDIKKRSLSKLNKFESNISGYDLSPDERLLALKINSDGADVLHIFEMNGRGIGREYMRPQIPAGVIHRFQWRNNEEIGFDFESTTNPSEIKSYNIKTGIIKNWTKSELSPELSGKIKNTRLIKWKSFDGREITGFLLEPKRAETKSKMSVVIDIHGGPNLQYIPRFNGYMTNLAAELDVAIISPNIRGSSGFGREFQDLDNKEKREDAVKDLQALLDWVEKQPQMDSDNVFVRGASYGGFMALALGLKDQNRIKGVIAYTPLISIKDWHNFSERNLQERGEWEYGSATDTKLMERTERLSLLYPGNLDNWKIPVFIIAGQNDKNLPIASIEELRSKLKSKGIPCWYIKGTNEGHGFLRYSNYRFYAIALHAFLQTKFFNDK